MYACPLHLSSNYSQHRLVQSSKYSLFGKFLTVRLSEKKNAGPTGHCEVQPTALAFSVGGTKLFCAYRNGHIYMLDFIRDKCRLLTKLNQNITAICEQSTESRLLVGLQDMSLHVLDVETGKQHKILKGHTRHIQSISIQPNGKFAVSVATTEAILWNLQTLEKRCKLHIEPNTNITSVFFLNPDGKLLLSCLRNGSIYVWNADTLKCCYHMSNKKYGSLTYHTATTTSDGAFLFAAGRSPFIHLWHLARPHDHILPSSTENTAAPNGFEYDLIEVIRLPQPVHAVRRLAWVPYPLQNAPSEAYECQAEELDGMLLVLGNDHHVRVLMRSTVTSKEQNNDDSLDDHTTTTSNVTWRCVFSIGLGSLEDPLIVNLAVPQPSRFTFAEGSNGNRDLNTSSYMALLDLRGRVHLHDLSIALTQFYKTNSPSAPVSNIANEERVRRRKKSVLVEVIDEGVQQSDAGIIIRNLDSRGDILRNSPTTRRTDTQSNLVADPTDGLLNRRRLRLLLKEFGHFPDKYRGFVWRAVLQLPCNTEAFDCLVKKGIHSAFTTLPACFPQHEKKLLRVLQKVCSALAFWSPIFGEIDWLPLLAYPFVKFFQHNALHAFEVVATVLTNWCVFWFDDHPNPPVNILCMVDSILAHFDPELHHHLLNCKVTVEMYAWRLLQTALSELFTQEEWLQVWDTIICYPSGFLIACVAAYPICGRRMLLRVHQMHEFETFFQGPSVIEARTVVDLAQQLLACCPPSIHPDRVLARTFRSKSFLDDNLPSALNCLTSVPFQPLTSPYYPIFTPSSNFLNRYSRVAIEKELSGNPPKSHDDELTPAPLAIHSANLFTTEQAKLHQRRKTLSALMQEVNSHEHSMTGQFLSPKISPKAFSRRTQEKLSPSPQSIQRLQCVKVTTIKTRFAP